METDPLTPRERLALRVQTMLGHATFALVGAGSVFVMRYVRGHRIVGLERARETYRAALALGRPMLVCANHLTMVDSAFLHWGLASNWSYLADFRRFAWNVPAVENFSRGVWLRTLVYLGKTIPIDRAGDAAHHKQVISKIRHVVTQGDVCTIFPEGGRSRTGRVEPANVTYGVGQILQTLERPVVLCAYLRGERQSTWGSIPAKGDRLHLRVELLEPTTTQTGLRGARDLARQVIGKLKSMEDDHFANRDAPRNE